MVAGPPQPGAAPISKRYVGIFGWRLTPHLEPQGDRVHLGLIGRRYDVDDHRRILWYQKLCLHVEEARSKCFSGTQERLCRRPHGPSSNRLISYNINCSIHLDYDPPTSAMIAKLLCIRLGRGAGRCAGLPSQGKGGAPGILRGSARYLPDSGLAVVNPCGPGGCPRSSSWWRRRARWSRQP